MIDIKRKGLPFGGLVLIALLSGCDSGSNKLPGSVVTKPVVTLTATRAVAESATGVSLTLSLVGGTSAAITYSTQEGTAGKDDFESVSGAVLLSGESPSAIISIPLKDDMLPEEDESFTVSWGSGTNGVVVPAVTTITILDDDGLVVLPSMGVWAAVGLFHPADECTQCHRASSQGGSPASMRAGDSLPNPFGVDISPGAGWTHTLMAHAVNDPWYRAKVSSEVAEHPELAGFIEDKCLSCHAPMAHALAKESGRHVTDGDGCIYPDGCLRMPAALSDPVAREGVSCTLCHRIDDRVLTEDRNSGKYPLSGDPVLFGPFVSPVTAPMINQVGMRPVHGDHMVKSEHCASCHDLFTPVIDAATNAPNGNLFPEQTPFREWRNSDFARGEVLGAECQECHMPAPENPSYVTSIAVRGNGVVNPAWLQRAPYAQHEFVGGNTHMLSVLREFRAELGIAGRTATAEFDRTIAATRRLLSRAAELHVEGVGVDDGLLRANVRLVNRSGHKLPTGFPSRRMWIGLIVRDGAANEVFRSGIPDGKGALPLDAVLTSATCTGIAAPLMTCLVPHRNFITNPDEVPVYEAVLGDTNGMVTHTLLHAANYLKDNRLPPLGFRATDSRFDPATASIGVGMDPDYNLNGSGSDTVHYRVGLGGSSGPWAVEARLYMQSIRPSFVASLTAATDAGHGFRVMMSRVPPVPEVLAVTAVSISP